jgi:hypothetical protein
MRVASLGLGLGGLLGLGLALASSLAGGGCNSLADCVPAPDSEPDYADAASWACRPDRSDDACDIDLRALEVLPDGSTQLVEHVPAAAPAIDCFYVYPTVDLRVGAGLHDDLDDHAAPDQTIAIQFARFSAVCRPFAPYYRQVTLGTYLARERVREACFDVAYDDVLAAFEHYLEHDNQGRGFVLIGHSQGGQVVSRLVRERVEPDAGLHARMVAALPIGWWLGVDIGGLSGGSFEQTPPCRQDDQLGCVIGYRSFAAGNEFPRENEKYAEGDYGVCVHPGDLAMGGPAPLSASYFPSDLEGASFPADAAEAAPFVLYRDLYTARCVADGAMSVLEVDTGATANDARQNPIDFDDLLISGSSGTHIYDMHFGLGDLIEQVGLKAQAYAG